jgi:hypothetical protein
MKPFSDELKQRHPYEPWKWREDWNDGWADTAGPLTGGTGAWVAFFAASVAVLVYALGFIADMDKAFWFGKGNEHVAYWLWAGCVLVLVVLGIYLKLRHRKYAHVLLAMDQVPVWLGGTLSGSVETGQALKPQGEINLTLLCCQTIAAGRSFQTKVIWRKETTLPPEQWANCGERIPVHFDIPSACRGTSWDCDEVIEWWLEVHAPTPGINLAARFPVPIFQQPPTPRHAPATEIQDSPAPPILPRD